MYAMLDTNDIHDLIVHLTIALTDFITAHLCFACYFNLISVYIIIICSHIVCTCTFFYFYTLIGSFDSLDLHIQVHVYFILLI